MSKNNLNEARATIGAAAAMIAGAVTGLINGVDLDENYHIECCLNVRRFKTGFYSRWECRWMDEDTKKLHTAAGPVMVHDQPAIEYFVCLERLKKEVLAMVKKLKEEANGEA